MVPGEFGVAPGGTVRIVGVPTGAWGTVGVPTGGAVAGGAVGVPTAGDPGVPGAVPIPERDELPAAPAAPPPELCASAPTVTRTVVTPIKTNFVFMKSSSW